MNTEKLFDVNGKTALITGSSQGLGLTFAYGLAKAGSKIILNGRDKSKLTKIVEQFKKDGFQAYASAFDVCNEEEVKASVENILNEVGSIDILVNNAGVQIRGPLEDFNLTDWQKIIDINLTGAFIVSKEVANGMIKRKAGKIINICSVQSELARQNITPYTVSKGGLKNLTKGMAADWAKYNIQINGIAPGYFKTELTKVLYEDEKFDTWLCGRTPANRWGEPEELIGVLLMLSSAASNYINGQLIYVDGGLTCTV